MSQFAADHQSALRPSLNVVHGEGVTLTNPDGGATSVTVVVVDRHTQMEPGPRGEQTVERLELEIPVAAMAEPGRGWKVLYDGVEFGFDDVTERNINGVHACVFRRVVPRELAQPGYRGDRA